MSPLTRLWNALRRARLDRDLRREMDTHLALIEEDARAQGASAEHARQQARAIFGSPLVYRERALDAVVATWFETAAQDIAFAVRRLRQHPVFTLTAISTLALAIGANVAIFTVINAVFLHPLSDWPATTTTDWRPGSLWCPS